MTRDDRKLIAAMADGDCPECGGTGIASICYNNNPDRCFDVVCDCTRRHHADEEEDE